MPTWLEVYKEGLRLKEQKQYEEAIARLSEASALDPKQTVPFHALTQCCTELGRHDEAIAFAKKTVEIEPDDQFSYIALSRAYQRANMIPEAEYAKMQADTIRQRPPAKK